MQGRFVEGNRFALNRMFKNMTAWHNLWDVSWEVAQEMSNSNDINDQMRELERSSTKREIISINSALRKEGFDVHFEYLKNNYYEE